MGIVEDIELIKRSGINVPKYAYYPVDSIPRKVRLARRLVIKAVGGSIVHKSDVGAVMVGVDPEDAPVMMRRMLGRLKRYGVEGFLVQELVPRGVELFVGAKRDPQFGPVVLFGMGGINVELYADVSVRLCPVDDRDCEEMINETKASVVMDGFRGGPKIDRRLVVDLMKKVCGLMMKNPIKELDLNPVIFTPTRYYAVDVRMVR